MLAPTAHRMPLTVGLALLLAPALAGGVAAQPGSLFPEPFRVEHHLVQQDGDGERFAGEPVVDTYGGSWIVSERPDGSRLIVDLARRELTEVRADAGTYWTLSFDRFAALQGRVRTAQTSLAAAGAGDEGSASPPAARRGAAASAPAAGGPPTREPAPLVVTDMPPAAASADRGDAAAAAVLARPGVRRLRVAPAGAAPGEALEVWVDPAIRLTAPALAAIEAFESTVLDLRVEDPSAATAPGRLFAAARAHAAGALPVRTRRPLAAGEAGAPPLGSIEDIASRVERLERFPADLVEVPEGLRRVPHPLEAVARFLEEEAERNAAMSGRRGTDGGARQP
jgi:hypothetical protein